MMRKCLAFLLAMLGSLIVCSYSAAYTVYLPHLTGTTAGWVDYLQADNSSPDEASFTLTLYNAGLPVWTADITVAGKSKRLVDIKSEITNLGITGIITYTNPSLAFRLSYEYQTGGLAEFYLTDTLKSSVALYFSDFSSAITIKGAAIANMTNATKTVDLYALGSGQTLGHFSVSIGPYGKIIGNPSNWFGGVADWQVEKIIAVADSDCLDGLTIGSDATLARLVFTPAQPVTGFIPDENSGSLPEPGYGNTDTSTFRTVFYDGFTSNVYGWSEASTADYRSEIKTTWYYLDYYRSEGQHYWWIDIPGFDQNRNLTIETNLKNIMSATDDYFGFTFGMMDENNLFDFSLRSDGWFGVYKRENGKWTEYAAAKSDAVKKGDNQVNILRIEKLESTLYFYVNDTLVYSMRLVSFFGNKMGYHIYGDQRVAVNYLEVTQEP